MKQHILLSFIVIFTCLSGKSQGQKIANDIIGSGKGSIMLNNDMELKGVIHFNHRTEIVSLESSEKSKVYNSLNIMGFEYYDMALSRQRIFFSLPYIDPKFVEDSVESDEGEHFFEVIRQFKDFSLLSRTEFFVPQLSKKNSASNKAKQSHEIEKIFFLQEHDKITPYLEIVTVENNNVGEEKSIPKAKVEDGKILSTIMGDKFSEVKDWAQSKGLDLKKKQDLIEILDHYESLHSIK